MGDVLDYERGKLSIGRRVKIRDGSGFAGKGGGLPATLKGASPKVAQIRYDGHHNDTFVPWAHVIDWVGPNGGPAPKPAPKPTTAPAAPILPPMPVIKRVPEPTALEARDLKAQPMHRHQIVPPTPAGSPVLDAAAVANLKAAIAESEVMDLGDLGSRIRKATMDLEAARGILRDMRAEHARQVAEAEEEIQAKQNALREVRDQARRAAELADKALGGGA